VVQDVEASLPVSLEAGIAHGDGNVGALASGEQNGCCRETDCKHISDGLVPWGLRRRSDDQYCGQGNQKAATYSKPNATPNFYKACSDSHAASQ
jgi:hypothetical protein